MKVFDKCNLFFISTLLAFFLMLLVFNIKSFILLVLLYGVFLFIFVKLKIEELLFVLLLFVLCFEKGLRGWVISVVQPGPEMWMTGYSFYFGFSLKYIFSFTLFLLLFAKTMKKKNSNDLFSWLLVVFLLVALLSSIFSNDFNLAFLGFVRLLFIVWLFFLGKYFFVSEKMRRIFFQLILASIFFQGFIGAKQFITKQPLGIFLEDSAAFESFGYATSDGESKIYRVSGLLGHPTFFASFLSILLPVGIGWILIFLEKNNKVTLSFYFVLLAVVLAFLAVIGTMSRSSWIVLLIIVLFFIWGLFKEQKINFRMISPLITPFVVVTIIAGPVLISRIASFKNIWSLGSGKVRLELMEQALIMMQKFPLLGVGLNQFTRIMSFQDLQPSLRGFMYPVHNSFLLFFSEIGILAGILFIVFFLSILYNSFNRANKSWLYFGVWVGSFTFLINGSFHTLFNQDPTMDFLFVFLSFLTVIK